MSLSIQNNVAMPQNQMAFKARFTKLAFNPKLKGLKEVIKETPNITFEEKIELVKEYIRQKLIYLNSPTLIEFESKAEKEAFMKETKLEKFLNKYNPVNLVLKWVFKSTEQMSKAKK